MEKKQNGDIILKEEFEGGLKYALYSNFSKYSDAFLELSDNAVSNRIIGKPLKIDILVSNKSLEIRNFGGYGMNLKEVDEFLKWGKIKERRDYDIGAYSQGGKAAMGYLGKSMLVIASPLGEKTQYRIEDDNLHDYKLKEYRVMNLPTENEEGFVRIEVGGLKRHIKDDELKKILIDTYRPLIENGEVIIKYNGEHLKINSFPVDSQITKFSFPVKRRAEQFNKVSGWIGFLGSRSGLKGGLRCYKLGRLICDREFFGHPDASYKQTLNFLFGEVYLNHISVTTNKTDFDRDSDKWIETREEMYKVLRPFIDELLGREIQEPTEEEKERIKLAKDVVAELMRLRSKELKGATGIDRLSYGQKPPVSKVENLNQQEIISTGRKNQPRTVPPSDAKGKRKRLKEFMNWDIRPMEDNLRSKIEGDKERKLLVINNLYPGFKAAKGNLLYLIETATIQLAKPDPEEKITIEEYVADFDELYSFFCDNLEKDKENLKKKKT